MSYCPFSNSIHTSVVNSVDAIFKMPIPSASVSILSASRASFGIFEKRSPYVLSAKPICACCPTSAFGPTSLCRGWLTGCTRVLRRAWLWRRESSAKSRTSLSMTNKRAQQLRLSGREPRAETPMTDLLSKSNRPMRTLDVHLRRML